MISEGVANLRVLRAATSRPRSVRPAVIAALIRESLSGNCDAPKMMYCTEIVVIIAKTCSLTQRHLFTVLRTKSITCAVCLHSLLFTQCAHDGESPTPTQYTHTQLLYPQTNDAHNESHPAPTSHPHPSPPVLIHPPQWRLSHQAASIKL